jgi:zinc and cadmium transporter
MTLGTLLVMGGRSVAMRHIVNVLFALLIPVGALAFHAGLVGAASDPADGMDSGASLLSLALAFSAGTFLCIAMSDLLPELQFHQHDRLKLSAALVLGLTIAWGVGWLEKQAIAGPAIVEPGQAGLDYDHDHDRGHNDDHDHAITDHGP